MLIDISTNTSRAEPPDDTDRTKTSDVMSVSVALLLLVASAAMLEMVLVFMSVRTGLRQHNA